MTRRYQPRRGAIAAGHPLTAAAGAEMLRQGGNAVDAAVAAAFVSFVAEYTVSATGGSGFALVYDASTRNGSLWDFFSASPGLGEGTRPAPEDIDFQQITIDYGVSRQCFYVGRASVAVPGNVAGLCALAQQMGQLPLRILLEPAVSLAREGCAVTEMQHFISLMLEPIFLRTPGSAAIFGRNQGRDGLLRVGDLLRIPDLADMLEVLGVEGARFFYEGEVAQAIVQDQEAHGGLLTREDLARYRVRRRDPLPATFYGRTVLTNPPPSRGGLLISFALRLLEGYSLQGAAHGSVCHLELLTEVMRVTNMARRELERQELQPQQQVSRLLNPATVARWADTLRELLGQPVGARTADDAQPSHANTTQISVIDEEGLAVSLTTTAGEGAGFIVPGTGLVLNNMMGEADLHPQGFHRIPPGQRIPSMMSPSVAVEQAWPVLALGSGGANRIRSAILQVLLNLYAFHMPLDEAVEANRVHWEEGVLQVEAGNDPDVVEALANLGYEVNPWRSRHMFFGGVHAVAQDRDELIAHGDSRRGGSMMVAS